MAEDGADQHHDEESQDDGEVGSEQALALLHGSAATEEGDEDDQGSDGDNDVGGGGVEGDVRDDVITAGVAFLTQVLSVIEDTEEGGLVDEHPDPAAQDSNAEDLGENMVQENYRLNSKLTKTRMFVRNRKYLLIFPRQESILRLASELFVVRLQFHKAYG